MYPIAFQIFRVRGKHTKASTNTSFITMQQAARERIRNPRSVILTRETRRDNLRERVSTLIRLRRFQLFSKTR